MLLYITEAAPAFEKWSGHCKKRDRSCMCTVGGEARKCRTRGSLRDAPDTLREARGGGMKERERLRETRTCRAKTSLRGTPGPVVSSSDQQPAEKWSGLGRTSRTGDAASVLVTSEDTYLFGDSTSNGRCCNCVNMTNRVCFTLFKKFQNG